MEKTEYKTVKAVETISVLPRTMEIKPEQMRVPGADGTMYVVYGYDPAQRKVWLATFIDEQEAEAWVHGSRTFGRPVQGAVLAGQEEKLVTEKAEKGGEMSDGAMAIGDVGTEPAGKPN